MLSAAGVREVHIVKGPSTQYGRDVGLGDVVKWSIDRFEAARDSQVYGFLQLISVSYVRKSEGVSRF